jgi:hypothetical protein
MIDASEQSGALESSPGLRNLLKLLQLCVEHLSTNWPRFESAQLTNTIGRRYTKIRLCASSKKTHVSELEDKPTLPLSPAQDETDVKSVGQDEEERASGHVSAR